MLNGTIALRVPLDVIKAKCASYRQHGKPWHRAGLQNLDDYDIVRIYGAEYRGVVSYYPLASDVWRLHALRWNAETSMLKTLAAKHKSTVTKMAARYKAKIETPTRAAYVLRGPSPPRRQEGPGSTVRRDTAPAKQERVHRRPRSGPGAHTPQGADPPAPHAQVRAMRAARHGGCPPGRHARPARDTRTRPARVGGPHGQETAQDPRGLPSLPRRHPRNPCHGRGVIAGEPSALKGARWVRREAARKRPDFTTCEPGPRRAAHPVHEKVDTTQIYLHADLAIKERALARTKHPDVQPGRYRPPDNVLAFLDAL